MLFLRKGLINIFPQKIKELLLPKMLTEIEDHDEFLDSTDDTINNFKMIENGNSAGLGLANYSFDQYHEMKELMEKNAKRNETMFK